MAIDSGTKIILLSRNGGIATYTKSTLCIIIYNSSDEVTAHKTISRFTLAPLEYNYKHKCFYFYKTLCGGLNSKYKILIL
jgi:hypothetical protein